MRGYPLSTHLTISGMSMSDWWFIKIRTPGPEGTFTGTGMEAPPIKDNGAVVSRPRNWAHGMRIRSRREGRSQHKGTTKKRCIGSQSSMAAQTTVMAR